MSCEMLTDNPLPVYADAAVRRRRLHQVVCLWKGEPYIMQAADAEAVVSPPHLIKAVPLDHYESHNSITIDYTSPHCIVRDLQLGYINHAEDCVYYLRGHSVQSQEGIHNYNIRKIKDGKLAGTQNVLMCGAPIINCLKNIYPEAVEAQDRVNAGQTKGCAFHRDYACVSLGPGLTAIYHKGWAVAVRSGTVGPYTMARGRLGSVTTRLLKNAPIFEGLEFNGEDST